MITNRRHEQVLVPIQTEAQHLREDARLLQRRAANEVAFAIRAILNVWKSGRPPRIDKSIDSFDLTKLKGQHHENGLRTASFSDGLFVLTHTEGFLETREHRLVLKDRENMTYSRRAVNVDSQAIPSRPVDLIEAKAIAGDLVALVTLGSLATALRIEAEYGWQHTYDFDDLNRVRRPEAITTPQQ